MRYNIIISLLLSACIVPLTTLSAATVTVSGTVTAAETGAPVDSAAVTFVALDTEEIFRTATDATGHYTIELPDSTGVDNTAQQAFCLGQNFS